MKIRDRIIVSIPAGMDDFIEQAALGIIYEFAELTEGHKTIVITMLMEPEDLGWAIGKMSEFGFCQDDKQTVSTNPEGKLIASFTLVEFTETIEQFNVQEAAR